jgi:hypothetical protein
MLIMLYESNIKNLIFFMEIKKKLIAVEIRIFNIIFEWSIIVN